MKNLIILVLSLLLNVMTFGQQLLPADIENVLKQTKNRKELEKVIAHCKKANDALVLKSAYFLIRNMPVHNTQTYYWANKVGKRVPFNELNYPTFNDAVETIEKLKTSIDGLHPIAYTYKDIDSMQALFLIENIELSVSKYRSKKEQVSEADFFEYVLPYRVSTEPLQNWRNSYAIKFANLFDNKQSPQSNITLLKQTITSKFTNLWGIEEKTEPLPRLGAMQILFRQKGMCEDLASMATFVARSQGIPATVDNIPAWATSTGNHFLNFIQLDSSHTHFDAVLDSLGREPAKVLRTTYSPQQDAIATWLDTTYIPNNFLRIKNYKDVTDEYWQTTDIKCPLFLDAGKLPAQSTVKNNKAYFDVINSKVVFACVFNGGSWQPIWYGNVIGKIVTFKKMSKGVVYVPFYYNKGALVPAGFPYALGYNNQLELKPDSKHLRSITLPEQEKYLKFKEGKKYRLFVWNNQWQLVGEQLAPKGCTSLTFDNIPKNALLILVPEYSQGKERPFMILQNGERVWW